MVYLQDDLSAQGIAEVEQQLRADRAVASLLYVSKEQALVEFQAQFPADSHLLQGLGQNPLPASFVVTCGPHFVRPRASNDGRNGLA